jgi:g-D-glutamyl-meso-diaminopimelate peptidase
MAENQPAGRQETLDYESFFAGTRRLRRESPALQTFTIGRSALGRGVTALMLGNGTPHALFVGALRAGESPAAAALLRFAQELCRSLAADGNLRGTDVRELLSRGSVYLVPMPNPDGVEIRLKGANTAGALRENVRRLAAGDCSGWQANARGVDLTRNFNAGFDRVIGEEIARQRVGPAQEGFFGIRAESEPETHALCNLCRRIPFRRAVCFHTGGRRLGWYYGERTPKAAHTAALQLARAGGCTLRRKEEGYEPGTFPAWFTRVFARPALDVGIGNAGMADAVGRSGNAQKSEEGESADTLCNRLLEVMLEGLAL